MLRKQIIFSLDTYKKNVNDSDITVLLNGKTLNRVYHSKFLGVVIDEYITWNNHINSIESKMAKNVGILTKLRFTLPRQI